MDLLNDILFGFSKSNVIYSPLNTGVINIPWKFFTSSLKMIIYYFKKCFFIHINRFNNKYR